MELVDAADYQQLRKDKSFRSGSASIAVTDDDEDIVFMQHPVDRPIRESVTETVPKGRFVAGEAFFNYAAFGSLREGLPTVALFSPQYFGLVFNAMVAGFTVTFTTYALQPLLVMVLTEYQPNQIDAAGKVVQWPGALAVFFGLVSDCFPICGYRRKSYMMLGWILSSAMYLAMCVLDWTLDKNLSSMGYLFVIISVGANIGYQLMWLASLAMTVEFAQREHLYERGHLQSLYFIVHFASASLTNLLCAFVIKPQLDGSYKSDLSVGSVALVLGIACLLPLPVLHWFLAEDKALANSVSIRTRLQELWSFLQQKVVYCIFFYLVVTIFLLSASSPDVQTAVLGWSGYTNTKAMWLALAFESPKLIGVLIFKSLFINFDWRKIGCIGLVFYIFTNFSLTLPVTYNQVRSTWYLYLWIALGQIPQGWFELFIVIPATEIADVGREGVTMGLISSFMQLISIAGGTLWNSLNKAVGTKITVQQIAEDDHAVHKHVTVSLVIYSCIQLAALVMFWFLPAQKLDAQQLRAFGGFNSAARLAIVGVFMALLVYDLGTNLANW